jgi:two-component system LytT family response regulator
MKKINTIIIDDEPKSVEILSLMLKNFQNDVEILDTAGSMKEGLEVIEKHKAVLHLLFLDIQMPGGDGFSLLQHIPDISFRIIFTTAYDQFAIKAIRFSALDYLLKPIDLKELDLALAKFREGNHPPEQQRLHHFTDTLGQKSLFKKLAIATLHEIKFIHLDKISYLESDNNYTTIYMGNSQRLVSSKNIGYYEDLLEENGFFRVNNSSLVNLMKIERFIKGKTGSIELEDGKTLPVSSSKKETLLRLLGRH